MKYLIYTVLGLIGFAVLSILFFPLSTIFKTVNMAYNIQDKTLDANNAIYNYEWFKQQYEDIGAARIQYVNSDDAAVAFEATFPDKTEWTFEDKGEYSRLNSIRLGLKNYVETLIADYNARMKMTNRALFSDTLLPPFIDSITYLKR